MPAEVLTKVGLDRHATMEKEDESIEIDNQYIEHGV